MPHDLRFFTMILPNQPWPELLRRYRLLEDLGFDLAVFADHFVDWTGGKGIWFECFTLLTAIASHTSKIRLGAYVAQIPLRSPALLAHQALTIDHVSNGRLELGLGLGLPRDPSYAMMGLPNWSNRERVARFPEYVQLVDRLLRDDVTTYHGQHYQADGAVTQPRPLQKPRPPIVIAAMGPIMLRHAAQYADTWNSISFAETFAAQVDETRERIRLVDEYCAKMGRNPSTLRRSYLMLDVQARRTGAPANYYTSKNAFAEIAHKMIGLGISEIGLYYPARNDELAIFEAIATEVIPALKQAYARS
jgi:alkanesulfonate monooxygenase SsuD/methylene tetrahydromethanopterin reductase-like flavin-dependent oxidoreductase (luciferase family)